MKTRLALLITAALLAVGLPIPAHADTSFLYAVSGGKATIIGYTGTVPTELDIPAEVTDGTGTYPVTAISTDTFANKSLTALTLPDTLTTIDNSAFANNKLTALTLPDTLTAINNSAFANNKLTALTLPDTLTTISNGAFSNNQLTALTLPDTLTTIDRYAFANNQLTSVRFAGAAPQLGTSALGTNSPSVRFRWKFGTPRTTGGYTTPTWNDCPTIAVADVTFTGGGDITAQSVDANRTAVATKPADPTKTGHKFTGWYLPDAATAFDFTTPITGDITLTAGFESAPEPALTGPATATVQLGDAFAWTPTTLTGSPAPTVTATGLPDGLEIDSQTGVISGTVTDALMVRDHTVTITVANGIDPDATFELTISIEYFTASIADDEATITGHHGAAPTALVIPRTIDAGGETYPVVSISDGAFSYAELTSVTFPDTLVTIGASALTYNQLTSVTIPDSVTSIGGGAFHGNQLTDIDFGTGVTNIGPYSVHQNPDLASVRFRGPAPTMPGSYPLGSSRPVVRYPWKYGSDQADGGYTPGSWKGYDSVAVADVTFAGGGDIAAQSVDVDDMAVAAKPADPVKAGHAFNGWFADGATTPFDFTTPIAGDTALTAGFKAVFAPTLTGPATVSAKLGSDVTWEPTTLTGDPAVIITATGLPDGLEIDSDTGAISGTVTDALLARDHTVTITASNGIEPDATLDLTISIEYFKYYVVGNAATIDGYHGTVPTTLVIPAEITDKFGSHPVRTISSQTFMRRGLTELTLPDSLTTIERLAFYENQLTELTLPDSLTTIGDTAFVGNQLTELTVGDSLSTIGDNAFNENQLTELTLPDSLTTIGASAFMRNPLAELTLGDGLSSIGNYAFYGNRLTDLAFPASLTTIGQWAFADNPVATARFTGQAPELGALALGLNDPTVRFPWKFGSPRTTDGYTAPTWIGYDTIAFADVTFDAGDDITTQLVDIDDTAAKPADPAKAGYVFTGWFADDATSPFGFTTPITGDITLTAGFEAEAAPVLEGPELVTATLGADASWTPTTLTGTPAPTVTATGLPDGLEIDNQTGTISGTVADPTLAGNHIVTITATNGIDPDATFELTISIEGFTYSVADDAATITGYHGETPADLVIPNEITDGTGTHPVTAIGDDAFYGDQLTELSVPASVTTIGIAAFESNQLTDLDLPNTVTTIDAWAFANNRLTELTLPSTLTNLSGNAFAHNQLTELALPNTLTTIEAAAFEDNRLTELSVPASVTSIGQEAFADNPGLDNVRFVGAAPGLGDDALGTSDPTVRFRWKLGHPRTTNGYTTPTWNGYDTIAVADVSFVGGGEIAPQSVDVDGTSTAVKPTDPAKAGFVFAGWFANGATAAFDFTKPITGDIALTAGFVAPASPADPAITGLNPAITGNPREGKTLTAKPGPVGPVGATVTYRWLADGQVIKGATKPSLKLGNAQAGKRITVTITATRASAAPVTKTSAKTKIVSSAKRRIVVSTRKVGKNQPVTVTATGFKTGQKITIWLGKDKRYTGRADSRGVITKAVKFAKGTKAGTHRVRVTGQAKGSRSQTVQTTVRYR